MRLVFGYRGHEDRLFARGPNWFQVTFPPTRKMRRVAFIWGYESYSRRIVEAWKILIGKASLHRSWQAGYDQHIRDESARRANGAQADAMVRNMIAELPAASSPQPASVTQALNERNQLHGYVSGLLGLLQLVRARPDMPPEIAAVLRTNHRATDAAAYLTQIVPPEKAQAHASDAIKRA